MAFSQVSTESDSNENLATESLSQRTTLGSSSRIGYATCVVGAASVLAVVLTTHAHTFTEADSIHLAKAFQHYSVATNSPQPPGYPLVVLTAHLFGWTGSILHAYLSVAALAAVATIVATFFLARELFGERAGAVAVLVLMATPLFLYYSDVVSVYLTEAAMAPTVALVAHRVARRADRVSPLLLFPVLAVGGGFRPTMMLLMLPACVVGIVIGRPSTRQLLLGVIIALAIVAAWAIPMVIKTGGWRAYLRASQSTYDQAGKLTSLLYGASISQARFNVEVVVAGTLMLLIPAAVVVLLAYRRRTRTSGLGVGPVSRRIDLPTFWILGAWFVPYAVMYLVVQLGKPGYLLAYLPIIAVLAGGLVATFPRVLPVAASIAVATLVTFLTLPQWPLPWRFDNFFPTAHAIQLQDKDAEGLARLGVTCPPATCKIISLDSSKRFWVHDAESLAPWYSGGAQILSLSDIRNSADLLQRMDVYWVGAIVPPVVERLATPVAMYGTWRVLRTSPAVTDRILASGI